MSFLSRINITDLTVYRHLSQAPVGVLVQFNIENAEPVIALRSEMLTVSGLVQGVVPLDGNDAGVFVPDELLPSPSAFDVTEITELMVEDLAALPPMRRPIVRGDVCRGTTAEGVTSTYMAVALTENLSGLAGYVALTGPTRGSVVRVTDQFRVGRAVVVPSPRVG